MHIDEYIHNYTNAFHNKAPIDMIPSNDYEQYIVDRHTKGLLEGLDVSVEFLEDHIPPILKEVDELYDKVDAKLARLVQIAEDYQRLNTSELLNTELNSFQIFSIPTDEFTSSLVLPRQVTARRMSAKSTIKGHVGAEYLFQITTERMTGDLIKLHYDKANTIIRRIVCLDASGSELSSSSKDCVVLAKDTRDVLVIADNVNPDAQVTLDVFTNAFLSSSKVVLDDKPMKRKGRLLKVVTEAHIPSDCVLDVWVELRYGGKVERLRYDGPIDITHLPYDFVLGVELDMHSSNKLQTPEVISVFAYVGGPDA